MSSFVSDRAIDFKMFTKRHLKPENSMVLGGSETSYFQTQFEFYTTNLVYLVSESSKFDPS